ncbi:MAG: protein kinase, partial [Acidobacteria bacterium]|nr:protein kinase [Acidobacteriota bacterium]
TADAFIQEPIKGAAQALSDELRDDLIGRRLGAYRVTRLIGHGGMGAVYEAARADDQFDQQVAVKIIKRGMDTNFVRERFTRERRILARLEHPHIARLIDGGATEDGLPYFVMERVEGRPIGEYCEANQLSITDRLRLLRQVCAAVQFAHQNLVVHRDIKPSNILVTLDGSPKLLDFGIAKLINPDSSDDPARTMTELRMMTPDYASPEQVRGLAITTASDIYSLGAVLYELLTGKRPHQFKSYSMSEIERVVCEAETEKPSAAVARETAAPAKLRKQLAGDLDNIILMAMRKEPERRYQSVEQFSEDIRRHLEGLPVIARNDTFTYRAGKFARRHKLGIAAVALVILSLAGGVVATTRESRIARAERARAETEQARAERNLAEAQAQRIEADAQRTEAIRQRTEAETQRAEALNQRSAAERQRAEAETQRERAERRFTQVRKLANTFLFDFHDEIQHLAGSTKAREMVVKTALEYLDSLAKESADEPALERELAEAYRKVGDVQGDPFMFNLGHTDAAMQSYQKSVSMAQKLATQRGADVSIRRTLAQSYFKLGVLLSENGDRATGLPIMEQALSVAEPLLAETDDPGDSALVENCYDRIGGAYLDGGDPQRALENYQRTRQVVERRLKRHPSESARYRAGTSYAHIGEALSVMGDLAGAIENNRQSQAVYAALAAANPASAFYRRQLLVAHQWLGNLHGNPTSINLGDTAAALDHYQQVLRLAKELTAADPKETQARLHFANAYAKLGDVASESEPQRSAELYRQALAITRALLEASPNEFRFLRRQAQYLRNLASPLRRLGERHSALEHARQSFEIVESLAAKDPTNAPLQTDLYHSLMALAESQLSLNDHDAALEDYHRALVIAENSATAHPANIYLRWHLADAYSGLGQFHAILAAHSRTPSAERIAHWQAARDWLNKSLSVWDGWSAHGVSSVFNITKREQVARALARCEAALDKLSANPHR